MCDYSVTIHPERGFNDTMMRAGRALPSGESIGSTGAVTDVTQEFSNHSGNLKVFLRTQPLISIPLFFIDI